MLSSVLDDYIWGACATTKKANVVEVLGGDYDITVVDVLIVIASPLSGHHYGVNNLWIGDAFCGIGSRV